MKKLKMLIFIPTYNECDNVEKMCNEINTLDLGCDMLFVDDNSPDGTGEILERLANKYSNIIVKHRQGKQGIGSAHKVGISYAYANGYDLLITMDSDFTHNPKDLPLLLAVNNGYDVTIGSRFIKKNSLPGWNLFRKSLTHFGHFLTKYLLGVTQDASTAFRIYNLRNISSDVFQKVTSNSYPFFFESLFLLKTNGYKFNEIPIVLSARTYGHSKMNFKEAFYGGLFLLWLAIVENLNLRRFKLERKCR